MALSAPQALSENNCRAPVALLFGYATVVLKQILITVKVRFPRCAEGKHNCNYAKIIIMFDIEWKSKSKIHF